MCNVTVSKMSGPPRRSHRHAGHWLDAMKPRAPGLRRRLGVIAAQAARPERDGDPRVAYVAAFALSWQAF